ncbi:hypothetical protein EV702DRAFT_471494 [Suillus placidus]|uniref:Uncharacterized protein n=1 Tax=Suillus placidus TaxID=48579 RepID=A0A9P6ZQI1_9AGAM|nr:hypothetical protein EV702DRAFT_471494 [Suillus placidus]
MRSRLVTVQSLSSSLFSCRMSRFRFPSPFPTLFGDGPMRVYMDIVSLIIYVLLSLLSFSFSWSIPILFFVLTSHSVLRYICVLIAIALFFAVEFRVYTFLKIFLVPTGCSSPMFSTQNLFRIVLCAAFRSIDIGTICSSG